MRFYVDEDVTEDLGPALVRIGHHALVTRAADNKGLSDPHQLAFAARHDRIIITSDKRDFTMLHEAWVVWSRQWQTTEAMRHPGILVIRNGREIGLGGMIQAIEEIARRDDPLANRPFVWVRVTGWQERT